MRKIAHKATFTLIVKLVLASGIMAQSKTDSAQFNSVYVTSKADSNILLSPLRVLPKDFCSTTLPFFCRKEVQIEKFTKIPFRFRLGSLDYCNKLEGKSN